jgi:hypothetical protein
MAFASMNVAANELGEPCIAHISKHKHTIRYLIIAATALFSGLIILVFGTPRAADLTR